MNAYEILQVSQKASAEIVRGAWAILIRECHPDGPTPNAKRARELNEAYAVLKDPKKRAALDLQIAAVKPIPHMARRRKERKTNIDVVPPAYPDAYMGFAEGDIDDVIHGFTSHMNGVPPFVKVFVESLAKTAVKNARPK